mgnify:FL=1
MELRVLPLMKKMTMCLVGAVCSFALSACGGGSAEVSTTTVFKELDYVACDKSNPVPDEVALIAKAGINPVKRSCNRLAGVIGPAYIPSENCAYWGYFAHSVLNVLPSEVAKANSIGYTEQLRAPQTYDPANDFACD